MAQKCLVKYFVIFYLFVTVTINLCNCDIVNLNGKIAGNLSISECVNGYRPTSFTHRHPQKYITTSQFVRKMGYPAEEHVVQTEDGYILTVHRIPGKPGAPPVYLQHGFLCSSFDWVVTGKEKALAFKLADEGYDVWLGNYRGNTYSRCHTKYNTSRYEYWDFSWHEMGIHDLPTMITYVTETTGQKIIYIGHSMGTTAFFVMAIDRPDIASRVKAMMALAPVAFMGHSTSLVRIITPYARQMELLGRSLGLGAFWAQSPLLKTVIEIACTLTMLQRRFCTSIVFFTSRFGPHKLNYTIAPEISWHFPAGSSFKTAMHYAQEFNSQRFQHYDYGAEKNMQLYNSSSPPDYNISKIAVPIGIFWADNDMWANPVDVMRFYEQLPSKIISHRVEYPYFDHEDFLFAIDAPKYVYEKVLSVIQDYK